MFKKYITGGIAASAALAPIAAATPVHAAPAESPQSTPALPGELDPSTLESCSADFELNKQFIQFDETITGPATPVPHVSNGIIPVITFMNGSDEVSCILEPAWTDEASFAATLSGIPTGFFPYPGLGYYLTPFPGSPLPSGAPFRIDLFLQAPHTGVWTVTWSADLTPDTPDLEEFLAAIVLNIHDRLPEDMQSAWDEYAADITLNFGVACPVIEDADLEAALVTLAGGQDAINELLPLIDSEADPECGAIEVLFIQAIWPLLLNSAVVPVGISSGDGSSSPAVPTVGSSPMPVALTASALAALGTGLVFASRRRRQPA